VTSPEWIAKTTVLAIHDEQLAEHGGQSNIRDEGLLDSALARPQNQFAYGDDPDLCDLAAAYAFGIAKNHPFVDGNKRVSFVVSETFLNLNDLDLTATDEQACGIWLDLADGKIGEKELAQWFRSNTKPL